MRTIPAEIHINIMEYLGYEYVLRLYPQNIRKVIKFTRDNFENRNYKKCVKYGNFLLSRNLVVFFEIFCMLKLNLPPNLFLAFVKDITNRCHCQNCISS